MSKCKTCGGKGLLGFGTSTMEPCTVCNGTRNVIDNENEHKNGSKSETSEPVIDETSELTPEMMNELARMKLPESDNIMFSHAPAEPADELERLLGAGRSRIKAAIQALITKEVRKELEALAGSKNWRVQLQDRLEQLK